MAAHCSLLRLLLLLSLLLFFFFFFFFFQSSCSTLAADRVNNPSFLELSIGLNLSILPSYNMSSYYSYGFYYPLSTDLMFTVGMPTLDDEGIFFPILSSPSFNSSNSSHSRGFSLGFYISPIKLYSGLYNLYLAVCAGLSGNYTNLMSYTSDYLAGAYDINPYQTTDGFVVPVWIANLDKPIKDWGKASLGVVAAADSSSTGILQLKDGDEIMWQVSNVGMMEMRDNGHLLIFSGTSPSTNVLVWQSRSDTLLQGQKLTVGGELRSNDSNYLARMEKGGLVLYLNNAHFGINNVGLQQPPPYWILPIFNPSAHVNGASINQLISTAPCSNSPAFAVLDDQFYGSITSIFLYNGSQTSINLDPGSCNLTSSSYSNANINGSSWSFLRLEIDGRLSAYSVTSNRSAGVAPSVTKWPALDSGSYIMQYGSTNSSSSLTLVSQGGPDCGVPMACGPLGVCTPGAKTLCSCPLSYFEPRNNTDFSQGCKRQTSLPVCSTSSEHNNSTDFLELNSTASIFLFNGWSFNPTQAPVAACKSLCSSNCSCHGFFYQAPISACFFITDEFTLLNVVDQNVTIINYTSPLQDPYYNQEILAKSYATYLKVVSLPSGSADSKSATSDNKSAALIVILPTFMAFLATGMACAGFRLFRARKRKFAQVRLQAQEEKELQDILPLLPSRFSYKDLHEATKGFSKLLGAGGCGSVYAGVLWDGRKVAVKVLQVVLQGAQQSRQFLAEVGTIGRTNHHNIVRLYGFCWEISHRLLVYEYVERGSLDRWLFVDKLEASLDWETRYNVALAIGRGMHYLHEECEQPILHFDIKPQNILLGDDFVAKLADFGMSRLIQRDASSVVTGMRGTLGYIAPEWCSHGKVSKKSDIFSMGMVLLELVGGRKILDYSFLNSSLDPIEQEAWHLPSWAASKCEQGLMMEVVDKRLHVCGFDGEQAQRLTHIAFWCIHDDPAMRPSALTVVQWLEGISPKRCPPFSILINAALNKPLPTESVYDESPIDHISMF